MTLRRPLPRPACPTLVYLLAVAVAGLVVGWRAGTATAGSGGAHAATRPGRLPDIDTLIVYVFSDTGTRRGQGGPRWIGGWGEAGGGRG